MNRGRPLGDDPTAGLRATAGDAEVIAATYDSYMLRDRRYPKPLPDDLAPWHLYLIDGGHSVLVTLSATGEDWP
jgi:hypothetical protein